MEISGVSSGVVAATAQNNGDNKVAEDVVRNTLETQSQTRTETAAAVSQPTETNQPKATEGNLGTRFDASA